MDEISAISGNIDFRGLSVTKFNISSNNFPRKSCSVGTIQIEIALMTGIIIIFLLKSDSFDVILEDANHVICPTSA